VSTRQKRIIAFCLVVIGAMVLYPPQASTSFFEEGKIVSESVQYGFIADAGAIAYQRLGLQVGAVVLVAVAYLFATDG
jgi:hypothetical protein